MKCPKCQMEQIGDGPVCDFCGLVLARYKPSAKPEGSPARPALADAGDHGFKVYAPMPQRVAAWLREMLFEVPAPASPIVLPARAVLFVFLAIWGVRLMATTIESNGVGESFLHLVNLPFHEAGHVFFSPFGDFIHTLGGTLGQIVMPMVCCLVLLLKTRDPFGAAVGLWWFGENFLDIAPYINDAGTGELPLLGGNTGETTPYGFHDWEYLMTETGRLGQEHDLARASQALGDVVMILALAWMAYSLYAAWQAGRAAADREPARRAA